jgi:hypothetical protein
MTSNREGASEGDSASDEKENCHDKIASPLEPAQKVAQEHQDG